MLEKRLKKPFVWISGPPGSGKTTLVSSYLGYEDLPCLWYQMDEGDMDVATFFYYLGLASKRVVPARRNHLPVLSAEYTNASTFSRRYFEKLCADLEKPFVIVFDNYQEVPEAASPIHRVLYEGLLGVPEGVSVILISRADPHPVFARLLAHELMSIVGWDELRLCEEETHRIACDRGKVRSSAEEIRLMHDRADGWAAGLVLLLDHGGGLGLAMSSRVSVDSTTVFDYFMEEVFRDIDGETQEFLLKTSFLPSMTAHTAGEITGQRWADRTLATLHRRNNFITRHGCPDAVYQYHPLFRQFLLSQAERQFSEEEVTVIRSDAAVILVTSGQIEAAFELFRDAGSWKDLADLICRHAPSMLAQGRHAVVKGWIDSMPPDMVEATPNLLYVRATSVVPLDPRASRRDFEQAFALFERQGDQAGLFLSWEGAVKSHLFAFDDLKDLDRWISMLENVLSRDSVFPCEAVEVRVVSAMFWAMVLRQPQHPSIGAWAGRLEDLLHRSSDINHKVMVGGYLNNYYAYLGDLRKMGMVVQLLRPLVETSVISHLTAIVWCGIEVLYHIYTASADRALEAIAAGMQRARDSGVRIFDFMLLSHGAYAALTSGNLATAASYLDKVAPYLTNDSCPFKASFYSYLRSMEAFIRSDLQLSLDFGRRAEQLAGEIGAPFSQALAHLGLVQVLVARREYEDAESHLTEARQMGRDMRSALVEYMCLLEETHLALDRGDQASGIDSLRKALSLGREQGYVNHPRWHSGVMGCLCMKALEEGIEVEYVRNLIRRRDLFPESPPLNIDNWPWVLKVRALGRFQIMKDGEVLTFQGKAQKKPLDMLKALISLGGKDVTEDSLIDSLWPEADGDAAHSAFSTNLQRLRQLLGNDKAIRLREGRVSLDPRYCYLDIWAFERFLSDADSAYKAGRIQEARCLAEKGLSLYEGEFLAGDTTSLWAISMRERLRSKHMRSIGRLGECWEEGGDWERAAECYQRALEVDGLAEEFYQRLMVCYSKQRRHAEALAVHDRCRSTLLKLLGVEPCPKTEAIYKSLRHAADRGEIVTGL